jgi:hypothetical protein
MLIETYHNFLSPTVHKRRDIIIIIIILYRRPFIDKQVSVFVKWLFVIYFNINKDVYFTAGLYSLLYSTVRYSMIEENETGRTRGMYVGEEKCSVSLEKPVERRPFERPRRRWESNIILGPKEGMG